MNEGYITEVKKDGEAIVSFLYKNRLREVKKGKSVSLFEYENNLIKKEVRDDQVIEYLHKINEDYAYTYDGFIINGDIYHYIWDNEYRISGITNSNGELIVRYLYDGLVVTDVLENINGEWISTEDPQFIGNYNKIRLYGSYWDDETGWFYHNGVYEDTSRDKIIALLDNNNILYERSKNDYILYGDPSTYELEAEMWRLQLLSNSSYN